MCHAAVVIARRVVISGRVQGVFFRDSLRMQAERAGVCGWARNAADGTVEALLEGDAGAVERVVHWCRSGPDRARVDDVAVHDAEPSRARGFEIR